MKRILFILALSPTILNAQPYPTKQGNVQQLIQQQSGYQFDTYFKLPRRDSARWYPGYYSDIYIGSDSVLMMHDYTTGMDRAVSVEEKAYTVSEVQALTTNIPVELTTHDNGGGNWVLDPVDNTTSDNIGTVLVTASGKRYKRVYDGTVNIVWFGAVGTGNETAKLIAACSASASKRVLIPLSTLTVTNGTDCNGCFLIGNNSTISGRIQNYAGTQSIIIRGINQDEYTYSPQVLTDITPKILYKISATDDAVIQQKKTRGYLLSIFRINSTTNTNSLAVTTSDSNRRRLATVQDVVWAGVYKYANSAISGTWTESTLSAASISNTNLIPEAVTSGQALKYWRTTVQNSYIEFKAKPKNGVVSIMLLAGTTGDTSVSVTVNGTSYTVSGQSATANTFKLFNFPVTLLSEADSVTLRVTKLGAATNGVNVVGVNFCELKDWNGSGYDVFTYYRNASVYGDYLTQSSSNDAVILEYNSQKYGVAYHGGETNIYYAWYAGGALQSIPAIGNFVVARQLELRTSADISWGAFGGGAVHVEAKWKFANGSISYEGLFSGNIVVSEIYGSMFGANEGLSRIVYPMLVDLTTIGDGDRVSLGRTNKVIYENPTTKQRFIAEFAVDGLLQNQFGGFELWKVVGSYNKGYQAKVHGGKMTITNFAYTTNNTFE